MCRARGEGEEARGGSSSENWPVPRRVGAEASERGAWGRRWKTATERGGRKTVGKKQVQFDLLDQNACFETPTEEFEALGISGFSSSSSESDDSTIPATLAPASQLSKATESPSPDPPSGRGRDRGRGGKKNWVAKSSRWHKGCNGIFFCFTNHVMFHVTAMYGILFSPEC